MRKIYLIICTWLLASTIHAGAFNQDAAIAEINSAAAAIEALECDFVQTKSIKLLGDKMISKGHMYCQQPDKLRWEYTSPYEYIFILNGSKVQITKGRHSDVIDTNHNKMFKEIARIMMNSVLGKCLTDKKSFSVKVAQDDAYYIATLTPLKNELKQMFTKLVLHYDQKAKMVTKVRLIEKNGDNTLIELTNIKKNTPINASVFKVD